MAVDEVISPRRVAEPCKRGDVTTQGELVVRGVLEVAEESKGSAPVRWPVAASCNESGQHAHSMGNVGTSAHYQVHDATEKLGKSILIRVRSLLI